MGAACCNTRYGVAISQNNHGVGGALLAHLLLAIGNA
jgi:hypothetical protein